MVAIFTLQALAASPGASDLPALAARGAARHAEAERGRAALAARRGAVQRWAQREEFGRACELQGGSLE